MLVESVGGAVVVTWASVKVHRGFGQRVVAASFVGRGGRENASSCDIRHAGSPPAQTPAGLK